MSYSSTAVSIWDTFPKATFSGVEIPIESSSIEGGLRDHVHEYPHSPGGAPEKLGRRLYTFKVLANFDTNFTNYPGLYPQSLSTLITAFEMQTTADLRLPQMQAAVPAYAVGWTREMSAKIRSGERVSITFREDQTSEFLFGSIVNQGTGQIEIAANAMAANIAAIQAQLTISPTTLGLFASLQAALGFVQSLKDTALLYDARYAAALQQVQNLCSQIDGQSDMQPVAAYPVVETLHQIWQAAQQLQNDLTQTGVVLQTWTNPVTQDVGSISINLYGDTSQVSALLSLNPFPDNARVPAGTHVLYYPAVA